MRMSPPNHTQTPNDLFDHWLPLLNESELKVLLVIIRKTFGWHKETDSISISQLQRITGLSEPSILGAVKSLTQKGVINKNTIGKIGQQKSFYGLATEESNNSYPPSNYGGTPQDKEGGGPPKIIGDTKETPSLKETAAKESTAAAVFSKPNPFQTKCYDSPLKMPKWSFLAKIDIPEHDKLEIIDTGKSPQEIQNAVNWATQEGRTITKCLAAAIKYACKNGLKPESPKLSVYEELQQHFTHGEKYNNAECILNSKEIAFQRGMRNEFIKIDEFFSWKKFTDLCNNFQVKFNRKEGVKCHNG